MGKTAQSLLLTVRIANDETSLGLFRGNELLDTWTIATHAPCTANEAELSIRLFLQARDLPMPERGIICSVVPVLTSSWMLAVHALTGKRPLIVGPGLKNGIALECKDPAQVGSDRVVCAVAAKALAGSPVIVADFDAATILSVVDKNGSFRGGSISPGLRVCLAALSVSVAQISDVPLRLPKQVIGKSTADAICTGVVLGEVARIDGLIDGMWAELGYETALVATGRAAKPICSASRHEFNLYPNLALQGLQMIYELNRG